MADEVKALVERIEKLVSDERVKNDERLKEIEKKGAADAVTVASLAKISDELNAALKEQKKALAEIELKASRPRIGEEKDARAEDVEHKRLFNGFMRKGADEGLREVERKALGSSDLTSAGYLLPQATVGALDRIAAKSLAMRGLASVQTISGPVFRKPVTTTAAAVGGWGNERTTPTESNAPAVSMLDFTPGTLWAEPRAYQEFLDDAAVDIEAWLLNELDIIFGENEGDAFINGIGVERPRGILQYSIVANASYAWNSVGYIASGGAGAFASSNPSDKLIDLVHALKQTYRNGAAFLMNDATLAGVRKLKDGQGNYIWAPNGLTGGPSGVLLGYPVASDDNMPDIASNSYSIAFGNFKRGYQIVDRQGVTVMRDPFTAKPAVKFFVRKRVGGGIQNFEAIKLMKFATS